MHKPIINLELYNTAKSTINSNLLKQNFLELRAKFPNFTELYTDGSKSNGRVSAAAICGTTVSSQRLPDAASIFTAELTAIKLAVIIITLADSLSAIQAISNLQFDTPPVCDILEECHNLF